MCLFNILFHSHQWPTECKILPTKRTLTRWPSFPLSICVMCWKFIISIFRVESRDLFSSLWVCRATPKVSHLFFTDDSIIFSKAECKTLIEVLDLYCTTSGQLVNFNKSSILFSPNVPQVDRNRILQNCQIQLIAYSSKHLGLSSMVGRSKNNYFQPLKERI